MNGRVMPTTVLPSGNIVCAVCLETFCRDAKACARAAGVECSCSLCVAMGTPSRLQERARLIELATRVDDLYEGGGRFETMSQELADRVLAYLGVER